MKRTIVAVLALISTASADAGDALASLLTQPVFRSDGFVTVRSSGARTNPPACVSDVHQFAVDAKTAQGKIQLAGLLAAYTAGLQVRIVGKNFVTNCTYGEDIDYFYIVE